MKRKTAFRIAVVAVSVSAGGGIAQLGCASILGFDDFSLGTNPDGSAETGSTGEDAGGFFLQSTTGWVGTDGTYSKYVEDTLEPESIEVLVATDGGFLGPFPPKETTPEGIRYGILPPGDRHVRTNKAPPHSDDTLYVVRGDYLDMGTNRIGRHRDAAPPDTILQLQADKTASDAGVISVQYDMLAGSGPWGKIATPSGYPPVWNVNVLQMFDGTRGDVGWILRATEHQATFVSYRSSEVCKLPADFKIDGGGNLAAKVTCSQPPKKSMQIRLSPSEIPLLPKGGFRSENSFDVYAWPEPGVHGSALDRGYDNATLRSSEPKTASGNVPVDGSFASVEFYHPAAPNQWSFVAEMSYLSTRPLVDIDGGSAGSVVDVALAGQTVPGPQTTSWTMVAPVSKVTVGGKEVLPKGPAVGVGPTPTIVLGVDKSDAKDPVAYRITVISASGAPSIKYEILTSQPVVTIPPGVLVSGRVFRLVVATVFSNSFSEAEPRRGSLPMGYTAVSTNTFSP